MTNDSLSTATPSGRTHSPSGRIASAAPTKPGNDGQTLEQGTSDWLLRIEPASGWRALHLRELWSQRELLYFLILRDLKIRYSQTVVGVGWVLLRPLVMMLILTMIFGRLARMPSDGIPYAAFVFVGLVPWTFFANAITSASDSLISNTTLLVKVYFPRMLLPLSSVAVALVDFVILLVILIPMLLLHGVRPSWTAAWSLPLSCFVLVALALGASLWSSALAARFRDVRQLVPFVTQVWMYLTPIVYPVSVVPANWRWLLWINPVAGVVEGFRGGFCGLPINGWSLAISALAASCLLVSGAYFFRRVESVIVDVT